VGQVAAIISIEIGGSWGLEPFTIDCRPRWTQSISFPGK